MGDSAESLEQQHRKERKELQAHIQALKKAMKGDKTKKKEITIEISRLESELDGKHQKELLELAKTSKPSDSAVLEHDDTEECLNETPAGARLSKAQKRRDKKAQEEKERNERIKEQAKENLHGPRNLELQSISAKLKEKGLQIYLIPSDGDCLFKAISHQLEVSRIKTHSIEELRNDAARFIRENKADFLPFMSNPKTYDMLSDDEFEEYCNSIANTKTWGGQLEIRALSNVLKCPIHVMQGTEQEAVRQGDEFEGAPLIITYHRHMYSLGEHYNSTQRAILEVTQS